MAEKIAEKIVNDAKARAEAILKEARKKAEEILEKAKKKAEEDSRERREKIKMDAQIETARILRSAVADAKVNLRWSIAKEKEKYVLLVLEDLKAKISKDFVGTKEYYSLLSEMIQKSLQVVQGDVFIRLRKGDRLEKIPLPKEALSRIKKVEHVDALGGFELGSLDGKIVLDNKFESILEREERNLRVLLARCLFGS